MRTKEYDSPKAILERIARKQPDVSTREFLLGLASKGIRTHGEKDERTTR